ncbi:MAG: elongation factor G [Bacteroidota bacterium]
MKRIDKIRNIGIIAHVDAGKTTVTERMLYYSGMTHKLGSVDTGDTVMDTDPQESKRGITIQSAAITTSWIYPHDFSQPINESETYSINIIDTPGHVDFTAEVERSLRVLDGVLAVFCAKSGVEPQSETVWRQADKYGVPRIAFINKMDRQGADFDRVMSEMREMLNANPVALQIPVGKEEGFDGVIDLIDMLFLKWNKEDDGKTWEASAIPSYMLKEANEKRNLLLEVVANIDDVILECYLDNSEVSQQQLIGAIHKGVIDGRFLPILCGAAYRNIAVQPLLDAIVRYLPKPGYRGIIEGRHLESNALVELITDEHEIFSALVFKVISDPYAGKLALMRVYSGKLKSGDSIINVRLGSKERISRILRVLSNKFETVEEAYCGQIYALVGVKNVKTGDTLGNVGSQIVLQDISFPEPVFGYAIEPKSNGEQQRFGIALSKIQEQDPTIMVTSDPDSGQTILRGMGELHLEVVLTKLSDQYDVEVSKGVPKIAFKEKLTHTVEFRSLFKKQNSGSGQFADISFEMGPRDDDGVGIKFVNDIKGGVIPKEFIPSVQKGFESSMESGFLAGYPLESMRVRLFDGKIHPIDSHALDFEIAAREGYKNAYELCRPKLLEPIMIVDLASPEEFTGSITGDLNRRSGIILQMVLRGHLQQIKAEVPLRNLFGYVNDLRGMSAGRASASMVFSKYAQFNRQVPLLESASS